MVGFCVCASGEDHAGAGGVEGGDVAFVEGTVLGAGVFAVSGWGKGRLVGGVLF